MNTDFTTSHRQKDTSYNRDLRDWTWKDLSEGTWNFANYEDQNSDSGAPMPKRTENQRPQKLQCLEKLHKIIVHIRTSPGRSQNSCSRFFYTKVDDGPTSRE